MVSLARFQAELAAIIQVELQNLEWVSNSPLQSFPFARNPAFVLFLLSARHIFFRLF